MRPRKTYERMSAEAFDALMKLARLPTGGDDNRAARLVLVDGMERQEAARLSGVNEGTLRLKLWRYAKLRELARTAAGGAA